MDDSLKQLLTELAEFIRPIANGSTESPNFVRMEAEQLIRRITQAIESERSREERE